MTKHKLPALLCLLGFLLAPAALADGDWPWWRGPDRNGVAAPDQDPPTEFGPDKNVLWAADVPGRGHGSAAVAGGLVFLTAADEVDQVQSLLCFERGSGERLWQTEVHRGGFPKSNKKASHASTTPACDGERVFVTFVNSGAAHLTALDLKGAIVWQREFTGYVVHQGYGASPAIYQDLVIVSADNKSGGAIAAFDRATGEPRWRIDRPEMPNYASPIILRIGGEDQLLFQGCERVSSYDPLTGETNWEFEGATTECVTSIVTDGTRVFTSGGYPRNHVAAIVADGSGKVAWENISRVYVPSMLVKDGYLYAIMDSGIAVCWNAATGERLWRERALGTASASPVLVGDRIYAADERGRFVVLRAGPKNFEVLAENQLGDEAFSTPSICGSQIFVRVAHRKGDERTERLYCLERAAP